MGPDYSFYLTRNRCYKTERDIVPKGICVHSTGANNPWLKRYIQGTPGDIVEQLLGRNKYENHWNRYDLDVCVHAFIGKDAGGKVRSIQTLPWNKRGWHAGYGKNGSLNDTHISFEICEDNLTSREYFEEAMGKAIELCAYLCNLWNFNPLDKKQLLCHQDGYQLGLASNHGDIYNWLRIYKKDMDWFREEVKKKMNTPSEWAEASVEWAKSTGISDGEDLQGPCTREQVITMLHRMYKLIEEENK